MGPFLGGFLGLLGLAGEPECSDAALARAYAGWINRVQAFVPGQEDTAAVAVRWRGRSSSMSSVPMTDRSPMWRGGAPGRLSATSPDTTK